MLKDNNQKGITLYLSILILSIVLAIAFSVSSVFLGQLKVMKGMGYSVIAFYAADAGIEKILTVRSSPSDISATLSNTATYQVTVTAGGSGSCPATYNYCIKSVGRYKGANRAIEINY